VDLRRLPRRNLVAIDAPGVKNPCGQKIRPSIASPTTSHLLLKWIRFNYPVITRADQVGITKYGIMLIVPGRENTETNIDYTTPDRHIARP
jgi:hypothetical protein